MANICNVMLSVLISKLQKDQAKKKILTKNVNFSNAVMHAQLKLKEQYHYNFIDCKNCRVCLVNKASIPIFGDSKNVNVVDDLRLFGAIEINEHDNLPKFLCFLCYNRLQSAIFLRNTAQRSDGKLRETTQYNEIYEINNELSEDGSSSATTPVFKKCKQFQCYSCNLGFDNFRAYSDHTRSLEHINLKIECTVCKKKYRSNYIRTHVLTHRLDPEQAYICDVCGKSFAVRGGFLRHREKHNIGFPFKCTLCAYRAKFCYSIKVHMRTHTGEKPYVCPECSARFTTNSNLGIHLSTHKMFQHHKCDRCDKGYYRKRALDQHIRVDHCGIKDHICNICGKPFGYRNAMMEHQLKVHKRKKFKRGGIPLCNQPDGQNI